MLMLVHPRMYQSHTVPTQAATHMRAAHTLIHMHAAGEVETVT